MGMFRRLGKGSWLAVYERGERNYGRGKDRVRKPTMRERERKKPY